MIKNTITITITITTTIITTTITATTILIVLTNSKSDSFHTLKFRTTDHNSSI